MALVGIFLTSVLPIVAIIAVGALLGRVRSVPVGPLNTVAVYVLVPALVFHSLATTTVGTGTVTRLVAGVWLFVGAMVLLAEGLARLAGTAEPERSAFVLVSAFPNSGNFGIPLAAFAFGDLGRSAAVLFLAAQSVLIYTLGVVIASRGGGARGLETAVQVFRLPLVYAVVAAGAARWFDLVPPAEGPAMVTVKLVGDASIPLLLLIVGIQLAGTDLRTAVVRVIPADAMRLGVAPAVGLGIALLVGIGEPTVAKVFVVECATPAAVTALILLVEFGGDSTDDGLSGAEYVSTAVLTSTLASVPVLTVLIALLEAGVLL